MVTILASLLGFIGSILPEVFKIFRDKNDKKHELSILEKQIELQKLGINSKLSEVDAGVDIAHSKALYSTYKTGITWVDALNGTVRPVLAYAFFTLYALVKILQLCLLNPSAGDLVGYVNLIWNNEDQAIFAAVVSFYFGQRSVTKMRGR
jgi:hypothetical protein